MTVPQNVKIWAGQDHQLLSPHTEHTSLLFMPRWGFLRLDLWWSFSMIILGMIMIHRLCESEPAGLHLSWHPWVGLLVPHPVSRFIHLVIASIQRRFVLPAKMHFIRHFHSNKLQQVYPKVLADFWNNQTMPRAHAVPISNFFTNSIDHNVYSRIDIIDARP